MDFSRGIIFAVFIELGNVLDVIEELTTLRIGGAKIYIYFFMVLIEMLSIPVELEDFIDFIVLIISDIDIVFIEKWGA